MPMGDSVDVLTRASHWQTTLHGKRDHLRPERGNGGCMNATNRRLLAKVVARIVRAITRSANLPTGFDSLVADLERIVDAFVDAIQSRRGGRPLGTS